MKKIISLFALFFTVNFAYAFTFDVGQPVPILSQ